MSSVYSWYDPERKPPYTHVVFYSVNSQIMKTTYYVCRGYGDSISISSSTEKVDKVPENFTVECRK